MVKNVSAIGHQPARTLVVILADCSGSMCEGKDTTGKKKIDALKETIEKLVERIKEVNNKALLQSRFLAIAAFSSNTDAYTDPSKLDQQFILQPTRLQDIVDGRFKLNLDVLGSNRCCGWTDYGEAVLLLKRALEQWSPEVGSRRRVEVVLLTDGCANRFLGQALDKEEIVRKFASEVSSVITQAQAEKRFTIAVMYGDPSQGVEDPDDMNLCIERLAKGGAATDVRELCGGVDPADPAQIEQCMYKNVVSKICWRGAKGKDMVPDVAKSKCITWVRSPEELLAVFTTTTLEAGGGLG